MKFDVAGPTTNVEVIATCRELGFGTTSGKSVVVVDGGS